LRAASPIVSGRAQQAVKARIWARIAWLAVRHARGPVGGLRALHAFATERARDRARRPALKYVRSRGRHFWDLYAPGFPSLAFDRYVLDALERLDPRHARPPALQSVVLAITSECPLACAHCCEARVAQSARSASPAEVKATLAKLQQRGVAQVFLSGGEPLARFEDLVCLLESAQPGTDLWLFTSGWGLTAERARRLQAAGLVGIALSVDDWREKHHDLFRGRRGSFARARDAAHAVVEADLALCLSLCATKEFVSAENLAAYGRMARDWGAGFVQLLEPKAVGRWEGQAVALDVRAQRELEAFLSSVNYEHPPDDLPVVTYLDLVQRRTGCLGAGYRYLYVDSAGGVHPCPFCRRAVGRLPDDPLDRLLDELRAGGCGASFAPPFALAAARGRG
jgi:MoaA/NifB/PqqE/SkfB family radical SAM enzyme